MSDEEGDALAVMLQGNGSSEKNKDNDTNSRYRTYRDEWEELCQLADKGLPDVQRHAVFMRLQGSRLRSVYWQLLLESLPTSPSCWIARIRQQRNSYRLLHQRLSVDPHQRNIDDNPLSQSSASTWNQFFCDKELRALIRQDVIRTFPSVDFFRSESIQSIMVNVLFCYAREHPEIRYLQGMHEVLAPLLYVMQEDQKSLLQAKALASVSDQAAEILDSAFLEEDAYWLFCKLMPHLIGYYRGRNGNMSATGQPSRCFSNQSGTETELTRRLAFIKDKLLPHYDRELFLHLKSLDIPFQTFGIRWLRLLFGQEFALPDLLCVWDAVFAQGDDLVDFIVVSMLSTIRDQLLEEEDTECLMLLMRYPSEIDVKTIIESALIMCNPEKYAILKEDVGKKQIQENSFVQKKAVNQLHPPTISGRFKKLSLWSQKKEPQPVSQSYSSKTSAYITSSEKSNARFDKADGIQNVVEGFTLNDPMVARAELQHLHNLLSLVHSHLEHYHAALEHTLPSNTPPAGRAALAGIKQLCTKLRHALPPIPRSEEIESALEAQPAPRVESSETISASSESSSVRPRELEILKVYDGQELPAYETPCFESSESNEHVLYWRILGA